MRGWTCVDLAGNALVSFGSASSTRCPRLSSTHLSTRHQLVAHTQCSSSSSETRIVSSTASARSSTSSASSSSTPCRSTTRQPTDQTRFPPVICLFILAVYPSQSKSALADFRRAVAYILPGLYFRSLIYSLVSRQTIHHTLQVGKSFAPTLSSEKSRDEQTFVDIRAEQGVDHLDFGGHPYAQGTVSGHGVVDGKDAERHC